MDKIKNFIADNKIKILDIFIIVMICLCFYRQGQLNQLKTDRLVLDDMMGKYNELVEEYKDYRANSYVLHH